MKIEFPVKHIDGNLVFGHDKTVWAYYRVHGFSYEFLDDFEKLHPFNAQKTFLSEIASDLHFLIMPNPTDVGGILDETIEEMEDKNYELRDYGIHFMEQVKNALINDALTSETNEYMHYIGIQLNQEKNTNTTTNKGISVIQQVKEFLKGLNAPVYHALGLKPDDILQDDINMYKVQSQRIATMLSGVFSSEVFELKTPELINVIEKNYSTQNNNVDIPYRYDFVSGKEVRGKGNNGTEYQAVRPNVKDFYDVQDTNIEEINPKLLKLSKIASHNNGNTSDEDKNGLSELYAQYLTVSDMGDVHAHPGFEWLYSIQSNVPFPVFTSIRANFEPNEMVKRKLTNVELETQDQRDEAQKGGQNVDESVERVKEGARNLKTYFQESGDPAFSCNIVFKVTGETPEMLEVRVDRLKRELSRFQIKVVPPYGEQVQLLLSTIPSHHIMTNDYMMELTPSAVAGMMFGATTNIGDNRGFYIGHTKTFSRPVFIMPELAAKAFDGVNNIVDSLSILVAGMTGRGKSFFMNLFTYLSVLTGSKALIIDPKGDRRGWKNGLPHIPKRFIQVWEMGKDKDDAGSLDPFRTSSSMDDAKTITIDILSFLTDTSIKNPKYSLISEGVEKASTTKDPCIGEVIRYLDKLFKRNNEKMQKQTGDQEMTDDRIKHLEELRNTLITLQGEPLSLLLFGQPNQKYRSLDYDMPIQVLMIQNLNLPTEKERQAPRVSHKISEAIMISITAWTQQYMFRASSHDEVDDLNEIPKQHKIILQDEASSIQKNPMGAQLMDFIVRMGRYYNTTLLEGSQNATDHGENVANMGMKFSFALQKKEEAEQMLEYLNLPVTTYNITMLQSLERGDALFKDIYGGTSIITVNAIFEQLRGAFDTSTATEKERQKEKERQRA